MVGSNLRAEAISLMDQRAGIEAEIEAIASRLTGPGGPGLTGNLIDSEGFPRADLDILSVRTSRHRLAVLHTDHKEITAKIERIVHELHSAKVGGVAAAPLQQQQQLPQKRNAAGLPTNTPTSSAAPPPPSTSPLPSAKRDFGSTSMDANSSSPLPSPPPASPIFSFYPRSSLPEAFAVIDQLSEGSPAAVDGLELGDLVLRFGSVVAGPSALQQVAQEMQGRSSSSSSGSSSGGGTSETGGGSNGGSGSSVEVLVMRKGEPRSVTVTPRPWDGRGLLGCRLQPLS
eukprot:TRINITY_DN33408_c0_g1_i1.p1 TRINITY_DN33408_c0_g1~~TRINITY_DN33408_c0_g1_i1.p1  ORF type:complete len:286 (+),score=86.21 TRINITY_DN33408_c0_g1_i1:152-1009(+)